MLQVFIIIELWFAQQYARTVNAWYLICCWETNSSRLWLDIDDEGQLNLQRADIPSLCNVHLSFFVHLKTKPMRILRTNSRASPSNRIICPPLPESTFYPRGEWVWLWYLHHTFRPVCYWGPGAICLANRARWKFQNDNDVLGDELNYKIMLISRNK